MSWVKTAIIVAGVCISIVYFYFVGGRLRLYFAKLCDKFFPGLKHQEGEDADADGHGEDVQRWSSPAMPAPYAPCASSAPSAPAQPATGVAVALVTLAHAELVEMEPAASHALFHAPPQLPSNAYVKEV